MVPSVRSNHRSGRADEGQCDNAPVAVRVRQFAPLCYSAGAPKRFRVTIGKSSLAGVEFRSATEQASLVKSGLWWSSPAFSTHRRVLNKKDARSRSALNDRRIPATNKTLFT